MKSSKSPSQKTTSTTSSLPRVAVIGVPSGMSVGVLLCVGAWLSPFAASDRPSLALLAVTVSLPLGCMLGRRPEGTRASGALGLRAIVAGLALAAVVSLTDPELFLRTASWVVASALIGVGLTATARGLGVVGTTGWLLLCALPFCYDKLPLLQQTAEAWAMQGCPWLGFSQDALGGDPLRHPVIYMGHWSGLSEYTSMSFLQVSTLWLAAVPVFASLIIASEIRKPNGRAEDSPVVERAGA